MLKALTCLAAVATIGVASTARASITFPEEMASEMPCTPQCTLCHLTNIGGLDSLNGFGSTMKNVGKLRNLMNPPFTLDPVEALNALGDTDTDGDGAFDVDEVKNGTSPTLAGTADICDGPTYGCGAQIAKRSPVEDHGTAAAWLVTLALAVGLRLRRPRAALSGQRAR